VEIDCPSDCVYLAAAREHPAAVVRRQQEHDLATLLPSVTGLSERQHELFFLFHTRIAGYKPEGFVRLNDDDVAEATAALAATLETSSRGVIYEHAPQSLAAQRLATEMKTVLQEIARQGARISDREAAMVLRAIEKGARTAGQTLTRDDTAYLKLVSRLLQHVPGPAPRHEHEPARSPLIAP
jgi:hypothetical protein